jgi:hypothetical protein
MMTVMIRVWDAAFCVLKETFLVTTRLWDAQLILEFVSFTVITQVAS